MKIAVLVKQVPDTAAKIVLKPGGEGIDEAGIKWVVNPYDECAIEAALKLKEKIGSGEVVVIAAGPARVADAMRTALAMGCDRGVRIDTDGVTMDPFTVGQALAAVIQDEACQLVLGGKQAVDDDAGQVLQIIAEALAWPIVGIVESLELTDDGQGLTAHQPVSGGMTEVLSATLPIVLGCEKGLNAPRYPSLPGIMKAKAKPILEKKLVDLVQGAQPVVQYGAYHLPPARGAGQKITGEPDDVAAQLVTWLQNEAKVM